MKLLRWIIFIVGIAILAVGINAWVNSVQTKEVASFFFGLIFGMSLTIAGCFIVLLVLFSFLISFLKNSKRIQ